MDENDDTYVAQRRSYFNTNPTYVLALKQQLNELETQKFPFINFTSWLLKPLDKNIWDHKKIP